MDESALLGLCGVITVSRTTLNGRSFLNLEGFAPAAECEELSLAAIEGSEEQENGDDL